MIIKDDFEDEEIVVYIVGQFSNRRSLLAKNHLTIAR